jgi:hypothetical protein
VYLETSVVSYLVGRLSRDVIVLGNQELTREWWTSRRREYDLFISEVVVGEASIGDAELARQRLALANDLPLLARPFDVRSKSSADCPVTSRR